MATKVYDQFTDADNTLLSSHTIAPVNVPATSWTNRSNTGGLIRIVSNQAIATAIAVSGPKGAIYTADGGIADAIITGTLFPDISSGNSNRALIWRATDKDNFFALILEDTSVAHDGSQRVAELFRRQSGSFNLLASTAYLFGAGSPYVIQATVNGNSHSVTVSNAVTGSVTLGATDSFQNTTTNHGMLLDINLSGDRMDEFTIETLGGAIAPVANMFGKFVNPVGGFQNG